MTPPHWPEQAWPQSFRFSLKTLPCSLQSLGGSCEGAGEAVITLLQGPSSIIDAPRPGNCVFRCVLLSAYTSRR